MSRPSSAGGMESSNSCFETTPAAFASFAVILLSATISIASIARTPFCVIWVPPAFTPARFQRRKIILIWPEIILSMTVFLMSIGLFVLRTHADKSVRAPSAAADGIEDVELGARLDLCFQAAQPPHIPAVVEDVHVLADLALFVENPVAKGGAFGPQRREGVADRSRLADDGELRFTSAETFQMAAEIYNKGHYS